MICSVFMDDFIIMRHKLPFDFYVYYLVFISSILYYINSTGSLRLLPRWFIGAISLLIGSTVLVTLLEGTYSLGVTKQLIGLLFTSVAYYTFIAYNNFEIKRIFRMYLFVAFLVAAEGLLEEFLHLNGIHINSKIRMTSFGIYRIYGIMGEPYFLAVVLIPAMYFSIYKFSLFERILSKFRNGIVAGIILLCFILTFSSASFLALGAIAFFMLYNKKYLALTSWKIAFLPLFMILLVLGFNRVQNSWKEFNTKYTQTISAFSNNSTKKEDITNLNSSSFALFSNFVIAKHSFTNWPLTGTGIGTHENNYKRYFKLFFDEDFIIRYGTFNMADANSLFIRLMSETGLLGLVMFFLFMFKFLLLKKGYKDPLLRDYLLINQGIFILFIIRLIRTGNYFGNGFFLFFFMYYFANVLVKKQLEIKRKENEERMSAMRFAA